MSTPPTLVTLRVKAIFPTRMGCAIFLTDRDGKMEQFYIQTDVGIAINDYLNNESPPRPGTFDMTHTLLDSLGAQLTSFTIVRHEETDDTDGIYYARMVWQITNEVQERKIVEIDCRPSDGIALALRQKTPIHIVADLWEQRPDMADLYQQLTAQIDQAERANDEDAL